MQTMSTAMATLLKSGKQIGDNRPTAEVVIGDGGVLDFEFGDTWVKPSTTYTFNSLSVAQKANGKLIVCNVHNNVVMEGEAVDRETLLTGNDGAVNWVSTGITATAYGWAAVFNVDGELYLNFSDRGTSGTAPARKLIYKSPSGNGGDWELYSTIQNWAWSGLSVAGYANTINEVGIPIKLDNGNWIMNNGYFFDYSGYLAHRIYVMISEDDGLTWSNGYYFDAYMLAGVYYREFNKRIIKMPNGDLFSGYTENWGSGPFVIVKSTDNGVTWAKVFDEKAYDYWPEYNYRGYQLFNVGEQLFSVTYDGGYGSTVIMEWDTSNLYNNSTVKVLPIPNASEALQDNGIAVDFGDGLIIGIEEYLLGIEPEMSLKILQPKSITISRAKGMAGSLTLEFDNKDAILAPDGTTNPALLWPNKEVIVKQGYGEELLTTFTGLIDTISMSTFPQLIDVSARDMMKPLLDHYIRDSSFNYVVEYTEQTIEDIWKGVITKAGLEYKTVEETGLTVSKTFSWESYADAISWLDEMAGFETYCDEDGLMNFVYDGRPVDVVVAYEFKEGEDITRLGYTINDNDLYYAVVVYGKAADDSIIYYAEQFPQAEYWQVPSGKIMRIDASDADTQAKCEIIAGKAIYLMQTRAREVRFESIGIPHLQRGDFIQVTESSTTISEIYRITDISTTQSDGKYMMNLTCYYHGAPEVVE